MLLWVRKCILMLVWAPYMSTYTWGTVFTGLEHMYGMTSHMLVSIMLVCKTSAACMQVTVSRVSSTPPNVRFRVYSFQRPLALDTFGK